MPILSVKYLTNYSIFDHPTLIIFYAKYCEDSIYIDKL